MDYAIRAQSVSKKFMVQGYRPNHLKERFIRRQQRVAPKEFWALDDVSFDVKGGTSLGIIGHNGSGKSTALKVLAGIYRPTSGVVTVNGRVSALLELGAGFHPELTGRENIRLNGAILGLSERQVTDAMDEIIDFAGIEDFIDSPVKVYSSGMVVRLGFSVAARMKPEILIVDEIIAVGDEEFQRKCFEYLFQLRRDGATVVLVSHSMGAVENICDRAIWIDHGKIREDGKSSEVVRSYLAQVNEQESSKAPNPSKDGLTHIGSGEVQVTALEYLNSDKIPSDALVAGEPVTFRLHLTASAPVEQAMVGLGFWHESGVNVAGPNCGALGPWSFTPGKWTVDFSVDSLHLNPGLYEVSAAVTDGTHFYDGLDRAFILPIRGSGGEYHGLTKMVGHWSLTQEG